MPLPFAQGSSYRRWRSQRRPEQKQRSSLEVALKEELLAIPWLGFHSESIELEGGCNRFFDRDASNGRK